MQKIIILLALLITDLYLPHPSHAQGPSLALEGDVLIPSASAFDDVRISYKNFKYAQAIKLTSRLKRQRKDKAVAQAAAFLLGDLYTKIADKGEPTQYKLALSAFQSARRRYPNTEEALIALRKIGSIYLKKQLYYEAIASFNRIINKHPNHPVAMAAQLGKGQAYTAINKMREAIKIYDEINPAPLSRPQRLDLLISYGNAFYKLDYLNTAYEYFKLVPVEEAILLAKPLDIYHYGIAAFQSKDYKHAREIFGVLSRAYPFEAEGVLGLARMGDSWRMEGMSLRADAFYKQVEASQKDELVFRKATLVAAVGRLHLAGCYPKPLLVRQSECDQIKALESEDGLRAEQAIKETTGLLLERIERDPEFEPLLLETLSALERHQAYTASLWIKEKSLAGNISTPTRKVLEESLQATVIQSLEQLIGQKDNHAALSLFFRYRSVFAGDKIERKLAIRIGVQLNEAGFYKDAAELLGPIATGEKLKADKVALYHLIESTFYQGEFDSAEGMIQDFISQHPKSTKLPSLQAISVEILDRQGKDDAAIIGYQHWLNRYPKHPENQKVRLSLAKAHEKKGNLKQAIASYLALNAGRLKGNPYIQLKLADLHYRMKNYKSAMSYYQQALDGLESPEKKEWATLQLANSLERLGESEKGLPLFTRLAEEAKDELIQGLAAQKAGKAPKP